MTPSVNAIAVRKNIVINNTNTNLMWSNFATMHEYTFLEPRHLCEKSDIFGVELQNIYKWTSRAL